jgi:hypothetical protein
MYIFQSGWLTDYLCRVRPRTEVAMLPNYGVLIGNFTRAGTHLGQWLHAMLYLDVGGVSYECAVDVNEPTLGFQFRIFDKLPPDVFAQVPLLPDGYHELARNDTSGAIDYARSPLPRNELGCLAALVTVFNAWFGTNDKVWQTVTGTEAGDALIAMVQPSTKLYVFGAPYKTGQHGMHDVHCNQGDPAGSQWYTSNGIWQDGCVVALNADGTYSMYLGMFLNQTLNTDSNGNPV